MHKRWRMGYSRCNWAQSLNEPAESTIAYGFNTAKTNAPKEERKMRAMNGYNVTSATSTVRFAGTTQT